MRFRCAFHAHEHLGADQLAFRPVYRYYRYTTRRCTVAAMLAIRSNAMRVFP